MSFKDFITGGFIGAAKDAFVARRESKDLEKTLEAKIIEQKESGSQAIELSTKEWEVLRAWQQEGTWKDEYVTVSVVLIFNIIIVGAILQAFGYPQVLEGITLAIRTLNEVMVTANLATGETEWTPMGTLISVTIFAAIGVYSWKKLF